MFNIIKNEVSRWTGAVHLDSTVSTSYMNGRFFLELKILGEREAFYGVGKPPVHLDNLP